MKVGSLTAEAGADADEAAGAAGAVAEIADARAVGVVGTSAVGETETGMAAAERVETPEGAGTAEGEDSVRTESGAAGLRTGVVAGPVTGLAAGPATGSMTGLAARPATGLAAGPATGLAASAAGIKRSEARIRERMDLFMDVTCCVGKGLKQLLQHRNTAVRFP